MASGALSTNNSAVIIPCAGHLLTCCSHDALPFIPGDEVGGAPGTLVCSRCLINVTLLNISDHSDNPCSGPSGWGWVRHLPDEVGDPTGSQVFRWDSRRVHCMCRDGRGIGGGHLAEPPPPPWGG